MQFADFALATLSQPIGVTDTSLIVSSAANFSPQPPFVIFVQDFASAVPEKILVQAVAGNVFSNLIRGYEGSVASAHVGGVSGAQVAQLVSAGIIAACYPTGRLVTAPDNSSGITQGMLDFMLDIQFTSPAAVAVNISPNIIPFKDYTVKDGLRNCQQYPITLTPWLGMLIEGQSSWQMVDNGKAITYVYNGTNISIKA